LEVREGRAVGVTPSRDHPVNRGALCIKGWGAHELVNHPERMRTPLVRDRGIVRNATWDEALDLVAERFKRISEEHGPDALAFLSSAKLTNEENFVFMKLARAVFKTNNIDHCARL
jgi:predicted molibdopterin-dependent oxidoreductase YjgC